MRGEIHLVMVVVGVMEWDPMVVVMVDTGILTHTFIF